MSKDLAPWLQGLGLHKQDFLSCPREANPLHWGLETGVIAEKSYILWASENYQLPRLNPAFYKEVDPSLQGKYAHLHSWNAFCFPIYEWENILYVACLEPVDMSFGDLKVCSILSPYSDLQSYWNQLHATETVESVESPSPEEAEFAGFDSIAVEGETQVSTAAEEDNQKTVMTTESDLPSLDGLDFGSLVASPEEIVPAESAPAGSESAESESAEIEQENEFSLKEQTRTEIDQTSMNNLTTLTQADPSAENLPPPPVVSAKTEMPAPPTPPKQDADKDDLPDFNFSAETSEPKTDTVSSSTTFTPPISDDDYTPVPFISKEERARNNHTSINMGRIQKPEGPMEHTLTDNVGGSPSQPPGKVLSEADLSRHTDLKNCRSTKDVMCYIFSNLRRDYKKLMWVELNQDNHFYPAFIYGHWSMTPESWSTPINLMKPNIFRIVSQSNLPFHGEVSDNEINNNYFRSWTANKKPDAVTILPVSEDDSLRGFVVAFAINEEFDELASLKKGENLISLSRPLLLKTTQFKTAS